MAGLLSFSAQATISLEQEVKVTDKALYFNGVKKSSVTTARNDPDIGPGQYDYMYGPSISPHGDAIKVYKDYVFMTWYKGGKYNRRVMLTRYNMKTGTSKSIEFPHQHTGFEGRWWVGETHNTIAVGISPKNETIHLLYDMHAYHQGTDAGGNGSFAKDYFRYSYSVAGAATVADSQFTLSKFVKDTSSKSEGPDDYKHLSMTGTENHSKFSRLTYPSFFLNDQGDLFMHMRYGTSHDGKIVYNKYDGVSKWNSFSDFNSTGAQSKGADYNWSIYGSMKYVDGKIRIGFQRRLSNGNDKFKYQNGIYYAYSNDPSGQSQWKNYKGQSISMPVVDAANLLVTEPGDLVQTTAKNQVNIVSGFDWTVTDAGDVHIISKVKDQQYNKTVYTHSYQKGGTGDFITKTDFPGAESIYTSGDKVYLIGLQNGRPFIDQATGGTNNFSRVYSGTDTGKTFTKGVVHIYEGKLYYYLLEAGSGDKRNAYLQIIDLALDPQVSFDQNNVVVNEGYNQLSVEALATSPVQGTSIDNVKLYVDGSLLRQENVAPYEWGHAGKPDELLGLSVGEHTVRAVATDSNGNEGEASTTITVNALPITIETVDAEQSPNVAANLLDGDKNDSSRWSAQGFPKTVMFDLGVSKTVTGTKMWTYLDRAYQYRIEVSKYKGSGFTTIANKQGNTSTGQPLTTSFNATGRYVKLVVTGAHNYSGDWVSINEVEITTD
ncbi:hypothetical protein C2869_02940 [Saccharobesus litoralis]|uniref:F5/8 type C domain-containing protein n=1 Tax=Saccharobesus litoralis TaxID=2172099 RepID=A0A2S0VMK7_9ALTE|nr:hypothetical protein C2869_02940 [Saccharobesus litoralis]